MIEHQTRPEHTKLGLSHTEDERKSVVGVEMDVLQSNLDGHNSKDMDSRVHDLAPFSSRLTI